MRTSRKARRTSRKPRRSLRRNPQIVGRFRMPNADWLGRKSATPSREDFITFILDSAIHSAENAGRAARSGNQSAAINNLVAAYRFFGEATAYASLAPEHEVLGPWYSSTISQIESDIMRDVLPLFGVVDD